jgi:hypothetical protein
MEKTISLINITGKNSIKFLCDDIHADFSKRTTHILVYFDNFNNPHYDLYAELLLSENNEPQTNVFELYIPNGINSATIIVSTNIKGHILDPINAQAV